MTDNHPITPPPELVEQWHVEAMKGFRTNGVYEQDIATQAASWGADQELEACEKWLSMSCWSESAKHIRTARRPKPPSLKEQALQALDDISIASFEQDAANIIRRALEQLDD